MVRTKPNTGDLLIIGENPKSQHRNFVPEYLVDIWVMEYGEANEEMQKGVSRELPLIPQLRKMKGGLAR